MALHVGSIGAVAGADRGLGGIAILGPLEGEEALLGCWAAFSEGVAHSINVGLKRNTRNRIYRARFSAVPETPLR